MSKLDELKSLLMSDGLWAKKSLGQNFLIDEKALEAIANAAEITKQDRVIEVGPGTGFLTERLITQAKDLTCIELDADMVGLLKKRFPYTENLTLHHADALDFRMDKEGFTDLGYKVVANIPYYITSPLIKHFLSARAGEADAFVDTHRCRPSVMVLLVQKEVAEKVCSLDGRSMITVETQIFGEPSLVAHVPSKSFYPAPKVDSAVLKIVVHPKPLVPAEQMKDFMRIVKFGYSQKRKKLKSGLAAGLRMEPSKVAEVMVRAGIDPDLRAEALEIDVWKRLVKLLLTKI